MGYSCSIEENYRPPTPPTQMIPTNVYNVEMARSYASLLTKLCEAIPEQTFIDAEMEAGEVMDTCDKLRTLLNVLDCPVDYYNRV